MSCRSTTASSGPAWTTADGSRSGSSTSASRVHRRRRSESTSLTTIRSHVRIRVVRPLDAAPVHERPDQGRLHRVLGGLRGSRSTGTPCGTGSSIARSRDRRTRLDHDRARHALLTQRPSRPLRRPDRLTQNDAPGAAFGSVHAADHENLGQHLATVQVQSAGGLGQRAGDRGVHRERAGQVVDGEPVGRPRWRAGRSTRWPAGRPPPRRR